MFSDRLGRIGFILFLWGWIVGSPSLFGLLGMDALTNQVFAQEASPPVISTSNGQTPQADDPFRFLVWLKSDFYAAPRALLNTSPIKLGVGVASVFTVSRFDESLTEQVVDLRGRELMRIMEELGDANAVRPLAIIVFAGSLFSDSHRFQDAAFASVESLIYANMLTNFLKFTFGRERPWQGDDSGVFRPFSGNTSFPSGHATTAFAAITPWLLTYPGPVGVFLMAFATGTAFSRVPLKFHWSSDVVAGGLVGFSTAAWLVKRHQKEVVGSGSSSSSTSLLPAGWEINAGLTSFRLKYSW